MDDARSFELTQLDPVLVRERLQSSTKDSWEQLRAFKGDVSLQSTLDLIEEELANSTLVDVGCGSELFMRDFAPRASAYVGIDTHPPMSEDKGSTILLEGNFFELLGSGENSKLLDITEGKGAHFVFNGIETSNVPEIDTDNLIQHICKALKPGNLIFGLSSPPVAHALEKAQNMDCLYEYEENGRRFFAYMKAPSNI